MPLVQISLQKGKSAAYRRAIADGIHHVMVDAIHIRNKERNDGQHTS